MEDPAGFRLPRPRPRPRSPLTAATRVARSRPQAATVVPVRYFALAAAPIAVAISVIAVAVVAPADVRWPIVDVITRAAKVAGLFGCLVACFSFTPREHLFRGWGLLATTYALLVIRDSVLHRGLFFDIDAPGARWVEMVVVILANVAGVLGSWTMASAWSIGGVELPGSRTQRLLVRLAAVVMSVSITLPSLMVQTPQLFDGTPLPFPIMAVAGALGDALSLSMLAPVLLTALALRGSIVAWSWGLLATSMFGWLCYDATYSLVSLIAGRGQELRTVGEAFRALAAVAAASAGIAQRLVATGPQHRR
jgi:hypothetical protein